MRRCRNQMMCRKTCRTFFRFQTHKILLASQDSKRCVQDMSSAAASCHGKRSNWSKQDRQCSSSSPLSQKTCRENLSQKVMSESLSCCGTFARFELFTVKDMRENQFLCGSESAAKMTCHISHASNFLSKKVEDTTICIA